MRTFTVYILTDLIRIRQLLYWVYDCFTKKLLVPWHQFMKSKINLMPFSRITRNESKILFGVWFAKKQPSHSYCGRYK